METIFVRAYYNESISSKENGHQVNIMFYKNIDDDDYFDEEFTTTNSFEEAEKLAAEISKKGFENFLPKNN